MMMRWNKPSMVYTKLKSSIKEPQKVIDEVEYAMLEWLGWFNNRCLLEAIGNISPAEYKKLYYGKTEESDMVV